MKRIQQLLAAAAATVITAAACLAGAVPAAASAVPNTPTANTAQAGTPAGTAGTAATGGTAASADAQPSTAAATNADTPQTDGDLASFKLDRLTPWLDAKGTLRITGSLTTKTKISGAQLRLRMSTGSFDSRDRLDTWSTGGGNADVVAIAKHKPQVPARASVKQGKGKKAKKKTYRASVSKLPKTLGKGQRATFDFKLPAATLPLDTQDALDAWGARGLSLDLTGTSGAQQSLRTFTTWYPNPKLKPTRLGIVIPATARQYAPDGAITPAWLEAQAGRGGNLDSLLDSVTANPDAILALDPQLLMSVLDALRTDAGRGAVAGPKPTAKSTAQPNATLPTSAAEAGGTDVSRDTVKSLGQAPKKDPYPQLRAWWRHFSKAADSNRILALPWADADLDALHKAKMGSQAKSAVAARKIVKQFFPDARTDARWPRSGALSSNRLTSALGSKGTLLLSDLQAASTTGYTSDSRSTVSTSGRADDTDSDVTGNGTAVRKNNVLVTDSGLEQLAAGQVGAQNNSALAAAKLTAGTAAITAERPFNSRTVLMTLPRTAAADNWADVSSLPVRAPWLAPAGLKKLTKATPATRTGQPAKTTTAGAAAANAQAKSAKALRTVRDQSRKAQRFSAVFSDPGLARARNERSVLSCAATGWDSDAAGPASRQGKTAWDDASKPASTRSAQARQKPVTTGERGACLGKLRASLSHIQNGITVDRSSSVLLVTGERTTIPVHVENTTNLPATFTAKLTTQAPGLKTSPSDQITVQPGESARVEVPVEGIANSDVTAAIRLVAHDGSVVVDRSSMSIRIRAEWENIGTAVIGAALLFVFLFGLVKAVRKGKRKIPEDQLDAALAREQERDSQ